MNQMNIFEYHTNTKIYIETYENILTVAQEVPVHDAGWSRLERRS